MRKLFLLLALLLPLPAGAVTVERIAAVIDGQVVTVSEVSQLVEIRFFARKGDSEDEHRRNVLDVLIAQVLRLRDVERFGAQEIPTESIEARFAEIRGRFASPSEFEAAVARAELTLDEVRALIKRQLQVDAYIQERFLPAVFIGNEEIDEYYRTRGSSGTLSPAAREELRTALRSTRLAEEIDKWTARLRLRANVDVFAWR
ncbi:MAG: hypothetical protein JJE51_08335 [Thermoanaerobaculia bacterium]|nr:hypothetical protein [Thermoanaerobaculia bacterium]